MVSEPRTYCVGRRSIVLLFTLLLSVSSLSAQHDSSKHQMDHHNSAAQPSPSAASGMQDWAKARLAKSPRHQEWVKIKHGNREVNGFVVYPEAKKKATAVVVIHEINGLTDWVQSLTDQLAEAGYLAIAPDFLSGVGPGGGGTSAFTDRNAVGQAIRDLPADQITADLSAVSAYVSQLPAANGKIVVAGFCWGGAQAFRYATNSRRIKAAFVFYGSPPMSNDRLDKAALARIKAPVYGFYAGNDARINVTLTSTIEAMKDLKKVFAPVTYEGAGHAFMRAGDAAEPEPPKVTGDKETALRAAEAHQRVLNDYKANKKARDEAWVRWKAILTKI